MLSSIHIADLVQAHFSYAREEMFSNNDSLVDNETYGNIEKNEGGGFIEEEIIE